MVLRERREGWRSLDTEVMLKQCWVEGRSGERVLVDQDVEGTVDSERLQGQPDMFVELGKHCSLPFDFTFVASCFISETEPL